MIVAAVRRIAAYLPSARLLFSYVLIASLVALVAHAALNLTGDTKLEQRLSQPNQKLTYMESVLREQAVINAKQEAAITQLRVLHDNDSRTLSRLQTDIRWLMAQRQAPPCRRAGGVP
ncbi:hypothetical protein [Xylella fastidiosa]|uniref:hypothetical protein n=1 Tax=Xylella fastidiosa TaxID=2371 RepID=UPI00042983BF|nr:hypothetical protein [Xylella fastidiosa]MDC7969411.1 hypothetical protein [Xylella fastidiosa subsp. multiplex]WDF07866.1 hypothetical protein PT012_04860 [Xylella fastidiosa subsp. multiplex]